MPMTTSMTAFSPPAPPAELTLRICGTAQDGRIVRLRGPKCTIGTDRHCTLRLKASGVSPLHCLIIRGPERTIVRRWSVETRLNGRDFSEAILQIGDRLKVGVVEFEVVDGVGGDLPAAPVVSTKPAAHHPPVVQPSPDTASGRNDPTTRDRNTRTRRLLNRVRELQRENELSMLRLSRLEAAQRQLEATNRQLQDELARSLAELRAAHAMKMQGGVPSSVDEANLAAAQAQLQADRRGFDDQRAAWRIEREQLHSELARWNDALERRSAELDALSLELASRQTGTEIEYVEAVRHQPPELPAQTDSRAAELAAEREQIDALRWALADERDAVAAQRNALAADHQRLTEAQATLAHEQARLAHEQARIASEQTRIENERKSLSDEQTGLVDEQARLGNEQAKIANERKSLTDEQARLIAEQQHQVEQRDQLAANRQQIEKDREALSRERQQWHEERSQHDARGDDDEERASHQNGQRQTEPFNTQLERRRQELDARAAELESQQKQLEQQAEALTKARTEQAEDLTKARSEVADLRSELDRARQSSDRAPNGPANDAEAVRKLQSEIDAQRARLQDELREFEEHKNALKLERLEWQSETSRAEADMSARREEMDRRAAGLEKMQVEQESASCRLEQGEKALARRQEELEQAERELQQRGQLQQDQAFLEAQRRELERDRAQVAADRESLAGDRAAVASEREALEAQKRALEKDRSLLAIDQQAIAGERAALSTDREALAGQKKELEKERSGLAADRQTLAGERTVVGGERQALDTLRQQDRISEEEWARRLAELTRHLTEATERLNRARAELEQQEAALEATRREFHDQRQQWQSERQRMHVSHQNELETLREELRRRLAGKSAEHAHASHGAADGAGVAAASDEDNPVVREVLTELRALGESSRKPTQETPSNEEPQVEEAAPADNGAGYEEASEVTEPQPDDAGQESQQEAPDERRDDQDVSDYMTRLLRRLRGVKTGHDAGVSHDKATPKNQNDGDETTRGTPDPVDDEPPLRELPPLPKPRAMAPELSSDLMAMRELANLSARAAIDKHEYRNWGRAAFGKLTIALLAGGAGAGAIYFAESPHSLLMCAGLACLVVTLFWLLQAGILIRNVIMAARRNAQFVRAAVGDDDDTSTSQPASVEIQDDEYSPAAIIAVRDDEGPATDEAGEVDYQSASDEESSPVE